MFFGLSNQTDEELSWISRDVHVSVILPFFYSSVMDTSKIFFGSRNDPFSSLERLPTVTELHVLRSNLERLEHVVNDLFFT